MKNDSGVSNKWLVLSQLLLQISKTLPSHDVVKTITINFGGVSGKSSPNITLWVLLILKNKNLRNLRWFINILYFFHFTSQIGLQLKLFFWYFIPLRLTKKHQSHLPMLFDYCHFPCHSLKKFLFNEDEQLISINSKNKLVVIL